MSAVARTDGVMRYSQLVRWMKIALPLAALGLIVAMFVIPRDRLDEGLTAAQIAALGAGLKLDNPRFVGTADTGEPYEIVADWALPDGVVPDRIELSRPEGQIVTADHGLVTARADTGILVRSAETLTLIGAVEIETADGYRFETGRAEIGFSGYSIVAPGAVWMSGPMGTIEAGSMRGADAGAGDGQGDGPGGAARIWFENRVRVVIIPESSR